MSIQSRSANDVRGIERALAGLWDEVAGAGDERTTITRTCVLNLIVVVDTGVPASGATEVIAGLTLRHPNRAILVSTTDEHVVTIAEPLFARVTAHCRVPAPGRPQVCCEQITLEVQGAGISRVPGTVLSLLLPDLPVMIWWPTGDPAQESLFARLCSFADRVIVDSATFADPLDGMRSLTRLIAEISVSDLAWGRLTAWREMTAQFFDSPTFAAHLAEIERVRVVYEVTPGAPSGRSQALLYAGWLVSSLGWQVVSVDTHGAVQLQIHDCAVWIEFVPAMVDDDQLDRVVGLTIECRRARFSIVRGDTPDCAVTRAEVEGMTALQRVTRLVARDRTELLSEELRLLNHDATFERALQAAVAIGSLAGIVV